ncbi:MAG: hypothetical protein IPK68_22625 [Bdellovibrionales bacterium]|nr:hypothetical protein [Bdellovibrionales bacterium]
MDNIEALPKTVIDLAKYSQSGNGTSLKNIFERARAHAGWDSGTNKFWFANARQALELAGFIEVVETPSSQRWCLISTNPTYARATEIRILGTPQSLKEIAFDVETQKIVTTNEGFDIHCINLSPNRAKELVNHIPKPIPSRILSSLPSFTDVETKTCEFVPGRPDFAIGRWEIFDYK